MKNIFNSVYPFTTENISGYFPLMDLRDKNVLTVGSSGDQVFNALLCGAGKITLYDISPNTYEFVKLKRAIILDSDNRKQAYEKICKIKSIPISKDLFSHTDLFKMNLYFHNEKNFNKLKDKLRDTDIDFITGDIFKFSDSVGKKKYDRIIFSNVLQYLSFFAKVNGYEGCEKEFLKNNFMDWINHLNNDGVIQLMYLYDTNAQKDELYRVCDALLGYLLRKNDIEGIHEDDKSSIVTYRK